jgi:lipopolysaccharide transport system ATP-binding protein
MTVRLAFAVAAFLEPEILVIDEVLAVGDAEFQKKAIGKMQDISRGGGRTILFVSHNMAAIQKLCTKCILLQNGRFIMQGKTEEVIQYYLEQSNVNQAEYLFEKPKSPQISAYTAKLRIEDLEGKLMPEIPVGKPWQVKIFVKLLEPITNMVIGLGMQDMQDTPIRTTWSIAENRDSGQYVAIFVEKNIDFNPGQYKLIIGLSKGLQSIQYIDEDIIMTFSEVIDTQAESILSNKSGFINNQMDVKVFKN